jgi:hypothetical protein
VAGSIDRVEKTHERSGGETEETAETLDMGRLLFERNRNENLALSLVASAILGGLGATMLADRTTREKAVGGGYVPGVQP